MATSSVVLLVIAISAALLFISEKLRPDLIALLVLLTMALTGLVTSQEAFAGLSSPAIILLGSVYVMTGALFRTGVSEKIGRWILSVSGDSEPRLIVLAMLTAAGLSLFMNNIASGAVVMPAIMDITHRTKVSPSRLLLPMAFATQLGGMATIFTTSNIIANELLTAAGYQSLQMIEFFRIGVPVVLVATLVMLVLRQRLLPAFVEKDAAGGGSADVDLASFFEIKERLHEVVLKPGSPLCWKPLESSGLGHRFGLTVMAIERDGMSIENPSPHEVIRPGDTLVIAGRQERLAKIKDKHIEIRKASAWSPDSARLIETVEVMPSPHSSILGQSLRQVQFRTRYGLNVVAAWHNGRSYRTQFAGFPIQSSDIFLAQGARTKFRLLSGDSDWLVLRTLEKTSSRRGKMGITMVIMAISLLLAITGVLPTYFVMFAGALALVLVRAMRIEEVYQVIDWRSVFLVAGMIPLGTALTNTGLAKLLGDGISSLIGGREPLIALSGIFLATSLLNQFIPGGSSVPALLAPIAIATAQGLGVDPRPFALIVAVATGTSLLTPFAHPVNVLVMGPGRYKTKDYLKAGLPLVIVAFVISILGISFFYHLI